MVAAAVIGGAVVGGVASSVSASKGAKAAQQGADTAAGAQLESTRLQIEEISRQYDYQSQILLPQIQEQYNAQRAYSDILGFGGSAPPPSGPDPRATYDADLLDLENQLAALDQPAATTGTGAPARGRGVLGGLFDRAVSQGTSAGVLEKQREELQVKIDELKAGGRPLGQPVMGPAGSSGVAPPPGRSFYDPETGAFRDPNLDPTRLSDQESGFAKSVSENKLAAGAAGQGVYGENFQASPGYAFQVEEMNRGLDRSRSQGGPNIGGRAIMEAQRRAQGLAAGDYYNWAAGRTNDLTRLAGAEATDIQRMDSAGSQYDTRLATDLQRSDQGYYNYLQNTANVAGFGGGSAAQAVNASQSAGAQIAGAYGAQGANLSNIYANNGISQANAQYAKGAGINNAIQGGASNYIMAGYAGANIPGFGG